MDGFCVNGTKKSLAVVEYVNVPHCSILPSIYFKLSDGRIEQWGKLTLGTYTYTYLVPFTQTPAISPQVYSYTGNNLTWKNAWMLVSEPTTTGFEISANFNSSYCLGGNWKAIGY